MQAMSELNLINNNKSVAPLFVSRGSSLKYEMQLTSVANDD